MALMWLVPAASIPSQNIISKVPEAVDTPAGLWLDWGSSLSCASFLRRNAGDPESHVGTWEGANGASRATATFKAEPVS